jgi:hypothetical protein
MDDSPKAVRESKLLSTYNELQSTLNAFLIDWDILEHQLEPLLKRPLVPENSQKASGELGAIPGDESMMVRMLRETMGQIADLHIRSIQLRETLDV